MTDGDHGNLSNTSDGNDYVAYGMGQRLQYVLTQPYDMLAIVLGLLAITLNLLVLVALSKVRNRITSHVRLIVSLAVSDILVSGSVFLYIVNKVVNPVLYPEGDGPYTYRLISRCAFMIIKALNNTGLNITLLNLLLMALDHYIAIMKPLKYPVIVSRKKVIGLILSAWLIAILLGFSDFASALPVYSQWSPYGFNYCEVVGITMYHEEYCTFVIAPVCFGIMVYSYSCIYWKIHRRRAPGAQEHHTRNNNKALVTTLLALGSFMVSWLPLCLFQISLIVKAYLHPEDLRSQARTLEIVDRYLYNLLVFNSVVDPIIYTVRLKEVKVGLGKICRGCSCGSKSHHHHYHRRHSYTGEQTSTRRLQQRSARGCLPVSYSNMTTRIIVQESEV